jgi:phosphatidylcholine synthase
MSNLPLWVRKTLAWSVHLFTATGAVWGFLSLRAVYDHEWKLAIVWMAVAMFVDGFDGTLARWFNVKMYASGVDGALLDNIVDYFTYTVVPAFFLVEAELLPPALSLPGAFAILLASAYQFSQVEAKSDESNEYFFKGFPDYWNIMVVYMLIMQLNQWLNLAFLILFAVLVFVPVKYVYPTRTTRLKKLTLALTYIYAIIGLIGVILFPNVPIWIIYASFFYVAYYVGLGLWPKKKSTGTT